MEKLEILKEAKKYGYITAAILLITLIGQAVLSMQFSDNAVKFDVFTTVMTLVITYTYFVMLKGITVIATESVDQQFINSAKNFIRAVLVTCGILAFYGLIVTLVANESLNLLLTILLLVAVVYLGVVSIKIAKGFERRAM